MTYVVLMVVCLGAIASAVAFGISLARTKAQLKDADYTVDLYFRILKSMDSILQRQEKFRDLREELVTSLAHAPDLNGLYEKILTTPTSDYPPAVGETEVRNEDKPD